MRPVTRALYAGGAAVAAALAYAAGVERRWYALRRVTVAALGPGQSRPLRILHLSDLHLLPGQQHKHAFVHACAEAGADLLVGTGDFLGHPRAVDPLVRLLTEAAAGRPALAVLGSNDFYAPVLKNPAGYLYDRDRRRHGARLDTDRLVAGLEAGGWQVLENRRIRVEVAGLRLDVAGLGDPHIGRDHPDELDWSPGAGTVALRLGLVHAPYQRALGAFAAHGYDLVLAGHTHGGQLRVPGYGALVTNCDLPAADARGVSRHDGLLLHVSAGLGTSRYAPVRFACRPEATLLDVVAAEDPGGAL